MDGRSQRKWVLPCGRFAPNEGAGMEARVRAMESYVARLAEEMEFLISQLGREVADAAASAVSESENEEG